MMLIAVTGDCTTTTCVALASGWTADVEVLVLELWTSTVARIPTARPAKGFEIPSYRPWAASDPIALNARPMRRMEIRKP